MTKEELKEELSQKLYDVEVAMEKLKSVVIDYADHNEPIDLYYLDGGVLERRLDGLGYTNGWVIDRLAHKTYQDRGSVTRKIKRAQGYNV